MRIINTIFIQDVRSSKRSVISKGILHSSKLQGNTACRNQDKQGNCYLINNKMLVIIMGVSGCGKTTLGKLCAKKYGWRFIDADSFHSKANITKISEGIPLSDQDRLPWLQALHKVIKSWDEKGVSGVLACSALKESYRRILLHGNMDGGSSKTIQVNKKTLIVHLKGDKDVIAKRISCRDGHFMNEKLLDSQYDALEEPDSASANVLSLSVENSVDKNAEYICTLLEMFGIGLP